LDDSFGIKKGEHMTGEAMHQFYKRYAQKWDILKRIDFETQVIDISRLESQPGWNVKVLKPSGEHVMQTKKLIIATGVTNRPHVPSITGSGQFDGPIVHSGELGKRSGLIVKDPDIKVVTVLGGGKSAYDAVYLAASAGKEVEWVIRKSGKGPAWVFPSHVQLGPIKAWREVRIATALNVFADHSRNCH
jgi:cation diffusion facilitator CzcD-associated flavoprotein CzcO